MGAMTRTLDSEPLPAHLYPPRWGSDCLWPDRKFSENLRSRHLSTHLSPERLFGVTRLRIFFLVYRILTLTAYICLNLRSRSLRRGTVQIGIDIARGLAMKHEVNMMPMFTRQPICSDRRTSVSLTRSGS
jgi:hypothetical protein